MDFREEKDTLGVVKVPSEKYWGAQTQRSKENFKIGNEQMPKEVIKSFALVKKCAAISNHKLGKLTRDKMMAIVEVAEEIMQGKLDDHFPLVVWQTGSGTQSNMNVNEVIANRGNELYSVNLHPNDDVNMAQSSNDTFPTAMHIAAKLAIVHHLLPAINQLKNTLVEKEKQNDHLVKIGRTHLQDATPLSLGQEISGWVAMLTKTEKMVQESTEYLTELAIGGTAVGTGINSEKGFGELVAEEITKDTGIPFLSAKNKFHALTSHDELTFVHGALKALAADLMKIANDIRWLASGPRCGIGELTIPANEPGSSIMPGKVNPTQSEAMTMIACQVFGNDATVGFAASQGNFELNVFKPVIIYNVLQSITLLSEGIQSFHDKCVKGLIANEEVIKKYVNESLMLVTALNPHIGYEKAALIAKKAFSENITLKEAAKNSGILSEDQFDKLVNPNDMIGR
ncbi:class II fumarate hydratase [Bacillus timonensis]|nr:class II fumarate hydratase [Bacillus timonensis]